MKAIINSLLNRTTTPSKSNSDKENAKSFADKQKAEGAVDRRDTGLGEVPLEKIETTDMLKWVEVENPADNEFERYLLYMELEHTSFNY